MYKKAFTLIELMVVIAIIGILASIIIVSLSGAKAKSRDAKRVADIRTLQLALETYYNDNGKYPLSLSSLVPNYLPSLPSDPSSSNTCVNGNEPACYAHNSFGNNTSSCGISPYAVKYHLGASLESTNVNNASTFNQAAAWTPSSPYTVCSGGGGNTGSGAAFVGKSSPCGSTAAAIWSCYDVTNP